MKNCYRVCRFLTSFGRSNQPQMAGEFHRICLFFILFLPVFLLECSWVTSLPVYVFHWNPIWCILSHSLSYNSCFHCGSSSVCDAFCTVEDIKLTTGCIVSCVVEDDVPADTVNIPSMDLDVGSLGTSSVEFSPSTTHRLGNKAPKTQPYLWLT